MSQEWKLDTTPETEVLVDDDVLTLRSPLVRVHRDDEGTWFFDGTGETPRPAQRTELGSVVAAWPHVAALSGLAPNSAVVWSWKQHGWSGEFKCRCGKCRPPKPADLDRSTWPAELAPDRIVSVEYAALSGELALTDILFNSGGIALIGPGTHRRTSDRMTPVAAANAIRRWPHTMHALRTIAPGRGMRWNAVTLNWHEYVIA